VVTDFGGGSDDEAYAVAIQSGGKIIAAGWGNANGSYGFAPARYTDVGALDATFGAGGIMLSGFGAGSDDFAYVDELRCRKR